MARLRRIRPHWNGEPARCQMCGVSFGPSPRPGVSSCIHACWDHCHACGRFRGCLCAACNSSNGRGPLWESYLARPTCEPLCEPSCMPLCQRWGCQRPQAGCAQGCRRPSPRDYPGPSESPASRPIRVSVASRTRDAPARPARAGRLGPPVTPVASRVEPACLS